MQQNSKMKYSKLQGLCQEAYGWIITTHIDSDNDILNENFTFNKETKEILK